ncbi:MAG: radical SAM protein [Anaerolineae bacterium]|nr:radical SAM protein [Anaerolineae bacterium]
MSSTRIRRIGILVTGECNLHCLHCLQSLRATTCLDSSIIFRLLQEANELGAEEVLLSGGEPTVHPQILRIIGHIKDLGMKYSMNTNGQNFKALLQACSILPPSHFTVSLDGATQDSNDAIRGPGAFSKAVFTLRLMGSLGQKARIQSVLTKNVIPEIQKMIQLAINLGIDGLVFAVPMPTERLISMNLLPTAREIHLAISKITTIRRQYSSELSIAVYGTMTNHARLSPFEVCDNLRMRELSVDWHGNLVLCCQLAGYPYNENEVIASLFNKSLRDCLLPLRSRIVAMQACFNSVFTRGSVKYSTPCLWCARTLDKYWEPNSNYAK